MDVDGAWVLWVLTAASALHVAEEQAIGWQGWAARTFGPVLGVRPTWSNFAAVNTALLILGIACASVGWRAPGFALALPALCLINAVGFHLLPSLRQRRPNPGLFTAMALYLPIGLWVFIVAAQDGVLTAPTAVTGVVLGALLMAGAVAVLLLGKRFGYPDA